MSVKETIDSLYELHVDSQFEIAKALAANCGYQLVPEDTERSLEIKDCLKRLKAEIHIDGNDKAMLIQGLEALLK